MEKTFSFLSKFLKTDFRYIAHNGSWMGFSFAASFVMSLGTAWAFANLLPQEIYGSYKYVLGIIGILSITTLLGMDTAIIRSVAKGNDASFVPAVLLRVKWGLLGGIGSAILSLYYFLNDNNVLGNIFLCAAPIIPLLFPLKSYSAILRGKKLFKKTSIFHTVAQATVAVTTVSAVFLTDSLLILFLSYVIPTTLITLLFFIATIKNDLTSAQSESDPVPYGKHLSFMQIFATLASKADTIIVWHFLGPVAVATYAFAEATTHPFQKIFKSLLELSYPKHSTTKAETLQKTLPKKVAKGIVILSVPIFLFAVMIPYIYTFLFPVYLDSVPIAQAFTILFLLLPFRFFGNAITAQKRLHAVYISNTIFPIVKIALSAILVPIFGLWGVVYAMYAHAAISNTLSYILFKRM